MWAHGKGIWALGLGSAGFFEDLEQWSLSQWASLNLGVTALTHDLVTPNPPNSVTPDSVTPDSVTPDSVTLRFSDS